MAAYTKQDDDFLRSNYLVMPAKRMSVALGRCESSARQRMKAIGLKVPKKIAKEFWKLSQFKKGAISFNKGKKQQEFMSAEAIKRCKTGQFKKGHPPHNQKKPGAVTVRIEKLRDGSTRAYKWKRIKKGFWKPVHVLKWEKKFGKVPKGKIVVFRDKNTMNIIYKNLELITKEENMRRNSIHNLPPELKQTIRTLTSLKRKIKKNEKQVI